ncbi:MAG: cysteine peptidase family C39 domain-containing protein, partial [Blastocatellia bacterium]
MKTTASRKLLAPEIVQTSAMDCGPAALKCLLEGYGIGVSYGRLREACQTDVDGTSIDTLELIALQSGLDAEQVMLPEDHLLMPESAALPAVVVIRTPGGGTHFVVVWRRIGNFVQVMDPAIGRRWMSCDQLRAELYRHRMPIPAASWREWASSETFLNGLRRRLRDVGVNGRQSAAVIERVLSDAGWRNLAALDAATRMTESIVLSGGIDRGRQAAHVLESFFTKAVESVPRLAGSDDSNQIIPENYWMVSPLPPDENDEEQVLMTGCVLVQVRRRRATDEAAASELSPEVQAALTEKPRHAGRDLWALLRQDGAMAPLALLSALALAAGGVMIEAMLFQG